MGREYSDDLRAELAGKGEAMPDGSYPTPDESALEDAFRAYGRESGDKAVLRRYLVRRAIALGRTDLIPDNWHVEARQHGNTTDGHEDDSPRGSAAA